jgi:Cu(I)-responsive transcriptional regulator
MNVGEAAKRCGLPVKTIRYYEEIGLVVPGRQDNGYRAYGEADVYKLQFLQRSRSLGFSIQDCRSLLSLYEDRSRASADVKAIAQARLADIRRKIDELESLHATLSGLVHACHGDHRPHCPILEDLAGGAPDAAG